MFQENKPILILALCLLFQGCVERYYPEDEDMMDGILVINAHLTGMPGMQEIEISRSSTLVLPEFIPVSGCYAELIREDLEVREFHEGIPGFYAGELDQEFLITGMSYQIHVLTPDGKEYESDFDRLHPVPEIDSLYYQVEELAVGNEGDSLEGIRYYLDFTYASEDYQYIRWDLIETYEFHNPDHEAFIYDLDGKTKPLPEWADWRTCWITNEIPTIYSMPLTYLDQGTYIKKPFDFVPNIKQEQKLHHRYSLLVRQYSVSRASFHYWNELKKTTQEQGGMFDKQPALLKSNICNILDSLEVVLGFFGMSGVAEKRVFAEDLVELDTSPDEWYCFPMPKGPGGIGWVPRQYRPLYFSRASMDGRTYFAEVNQHCVDCREYKNSTHIKPDFW